METDLRAASTVIDAQSAVSWGAIAAGAVGAAALALLLIAFGAGLGLSAVSPLSDSGVSASTFKTGTGIYLVIVAVMSSAVGGYLAARLRTKWARVNSHEVFFRDTAQGFLAWAFATLLSATALSSATAYLANGTAAAMGGSALQAAGSASPAEIYVDMSPAAQPAPASSANSATLNNANPNQSRAEVVRLWTSDFHETYNLSAADKTYVAQVVAARTGLSEPHADKRVDDVIAEAKTAADNARKGAAKLSFWLTAAMLFGAFAASLAAVEGGSLRVGTWYDRVHITLLI